MHSEHERLPAELAGVADRLRSERPQASAMELDEIKQRVMRRSRSAPGPVTRIEGTMMKSRLALASVLALGILFSGAGATLAVSGFSDDDSAGTVQYQPADPGGDPGTIGDPGTVEDPVVVAETTEQVAIQGDGELPLTGFVAIPLVVAGAALLTLGVVVRRRARD